MMTAPAEAYFRQGVQDLAGRHWEQAERSFRQALAIEPDMAEAHANLALLLERKDSAQAERHYQAALATLNDPQVLSNYAALLLRQKRFAQAEQHFQQALLRSPRAVHWSNIGALYAALQQEEKAEQCFRTALALEPAHRSANFNLAYLLLRQGRWEEGWVCFEHRNDCPQVVQAMPCPRWEGQPLEGKRIVVIADGGHGDMLQFCRYLPLLRASGCRVLGIECQPALRRLFAASLPADIVLNPGEAAGQPADWDFWVTPFSFPLLFKTTVHTVPAAIPYLQVDQGRVRDWRERLAGHEGKLKVGLVWKGNPHFENDADRSIHDPDVLRPLLGLPGFVFFSLQKDALQPDIPVPMTLPIVSLGEHIQDFAEAAAVAACLDLVISVDSAMAHLCGAMGYPCWVLLPAYKADWRWLRDTTTSPWYPQDFRLFRQPQAGDWVSVVEAMCVALLSLRDAKGR